MTRLGLKAKDKVAIKVEEEKVVVRPAFATLEAGFQSIPALKRKRTLQDMTEIASEEHAAAITGPRLSAHAHQS